MKETSRADALKGDLVGALSAATITLPMSIGYGITAFSALGADFLPQAAVIGIHAVIASCFFTALFNGTPTLISGPSGPVTVVLITIIADLQTTLAPYLNAQNQYALVLGSAALCLVAGGLLQALMGYFRIGSLIKYVPYPVISGFVNGIAISLILRQLPNIMGMAQVGALMELVQNIHLEHPAALAVGGITIGSVLIAKRFFPKISPPLFGLLTGVALHYALVASGGGGNSLPVVGAIQIDQVQAAFAGATVAALDLKLIGFILPDVLFFGLVICLVSSIETLLSSAAIGYRTGERYDGNKDLVGQGIGNMAAAAVSTLPSSGSLVRSMANLNTGGRTRRSGVLCSLIILVVFLVAHRYLGKLPLAALSGLIIAISLSLFNATEMLRLVETVRTNRFTRDIGWNVIISLTVTVLTVAVDLALAIVVGILITTANFVVKMGKSVVRRTYRCGQLQSKKVRNLNHTRYLQDNGSRILIVELQGPLFFGSADEVAKAIDASSRGADYIIVNLKRVSEIDITGTKHLLQIHRAMRKLGKRLLISHTWKGHRLWSQLAYAGAISRIGEDHFFADTDSALEYAEDQILCDGVCEISDRAYALSELDILAGFSGTEIDTIEARLEEETYSRGDVIIREGDSERDLFFLLRGMVSTRLPYQNKHRERRLNAIAAGVAFGEIALLDNNPRSADIVAEGDVTVCRLPYAQFLDLQEREPAVASKLILNLALVLSTRLRLNTQEIKVLLES